MTAGSKRAPDSAGAGGRPRLPRPVWFIAGTVVVGLLLVADRYGFHRDELYFVAAGRRLAWGFVDQPPLTPLLARLADLVPGRVTPLTLRVIPALSAGGLVVVGAMTARRLGGSRRAQIYAAMAVAGGGFFLAIGHLLSTTTFDTLLTAIALLITIDLLDDGPQRRWLLLGFVVGIGLQNKYTIGLAMLGLVAAIAVTPQRRLLGTRWPWLGGLLALAVAAPNLAWQAAHSWPQLEMAQALRARSDGPIDFLLIQVAILSITLVIPAAAGVRRLARGPDTVPWRPIPIAFALLFATFLLSGGKGYYVAAFYVPLLAAGAISLSGMRPAGRRSVLAAMAAGVLAGLPIGLPIVPASSVEPFAAANAELAETIGWPELIDQVADVVDSLDRAPGVQVVVFTSNYGEAGAIEVLGGAAGLPAPISGHNSYWMWGDDGQTGPIVGVGPVGPELEMICPELRRAATITNSAGIDNEEYGYPILVCERPTFPLSVVWDAVRHYN